MNGQKDGSKEQNKEEEEDSIWKLFERHKLLMRKMTSWRYEESKTNFVEFNKTLHSK